MWAPLWQLLWSTLRQNLRFPIQYWAWCVQWESTKIYWYGDYLCWNMPLTCCTLQLFPSKLAVTRDSFFAHKTNTFTRKSVANRLMFFSKKVDFVAWFVKKTSNLFSFLQSISHQMVPIPDNWWKTFRILVHSHWSSNIQRLIPTPWNSIVSGSPPCEYFYTASYKPFTSRSRSVWTNRISYVICEVSEIIPVFIHDKAR